MSINVVTCGLIVTCEGMSILLKSRAMVSERVAEIFKESIRLKEVFLEQNLDALVQTAQSLASALKGGKKILLFGNGGSAADAQHLAAEFVNRYLIDRPPLPAVALTTDSSVLTSIANDFSYDEIFEKQIRALGQGGDVAIGISTSGQSRNVVRALEAAREKHLLTIGIGGPIDSPMKQFCDHYLSVEGASTPRVQEVQVVVGHTLVELVDEIIFGRGKDSEV